MKLQNILDTALAAVTMKLGLALFNSFVGAMGSKVPSANTTELCGAVPHFGREGMNPAGLHRSGRWHRFISKYCFSLLLHFIPTAFQYSCYFSAVSLQEVQLKQDTH